MLKLFERENMKNEKTKNPAAVALGRLGGLASRGVPKPTSGFATPEVLKKAMETRRKNKARKDLEKVLDDETKN